MHERAKFMELFLLPLRDVHAHSADIGLDYLNYQKFDNNYTNIFSVIALIILIIACINFMNLSTARSAERAKEVGIRKSIGALRGQLGIQFLGETILLSLLAMVLALGLVALALPWVNHLSERHLQSVLSQNTWIYVLVFGGTILVGMLSGAFTPRSTCLLFQPMKVLKGLPQIGKNKGTLRNVLVVGQFTCAIFLVIATIFVFRQLTFMQQKDPGFDRDQVLTVHLDNVVNDKYDLLKQQLSGSSLVAGVTGAQDQLGGHLDQSGVEFKGDGPLRQLASTQLIVDPDYLRLYKIALVAGRDFSHEKQANGREYIINESLARELGKERPDKPISYLIGKHFGYDSAGAIVGIAKDFNFNSLHNRIETIFLFNQKDWGFSTLSMKIRGGKALTGSHCPASIRVETELSGSSIGISVSRRAFCRSVQGRYAGDEDGERPGSPGHFMQFILSRAVRPRVLFRRKKDQGNRDPQGIGCICPEHRLAAVRAFYPARADCESYLHGRWPGMRSAAGCGIMPIASSSAGGYSCWRACWPLSSPFSPLVSWPCGRPWPTR